jgi:hypothetical protein
MWKKTVRTQFQVLYQKSDWSRPAQLSGRQGSICKNYKQFWAAISLVETRVWLEREITRWYIKLTNLKMRFQTHFVCCVQNLEGRCSKNQLYYLNFKTKVHSWAKGNPRGRKRPTGCMLCSTSLEGLTKITKQFSQNLLNTEQKC